MPSTQQPEIVPPLGPAQPVPDYAPTAPNSRRDRRDWNPMSAPATYLLLAINIAVFLWMVLHGVSLTSPRGEDLLHYGAGSTALELNGEWFRLLTATFVHIGIIHLATNMWCLWNLGMLGEPLVGPWGLFTVYLLTGIAGNLVGLAWDIGFAVFVSHAPIPFGIGAGASGAVFGIAGLLIVLLSNRRLPIPWPELKRLRRSVIQFAFLNLIIGGATILPGLGSIVRIDNSAHIGGFLSGLALGQPLLSQMTAGCARYLARQKIVFGTAAFILLLFAYWLAKLV